MTCECCGTTDANQTCEDCGGCSGINSDTFADACCMCLDESKEQTMKDPDNRTAHTFTFSMKIETETHMAEVTLSGGGVAPDTAFRRGPGNWHNIMGMPLHRTLVEAAELLHAQAVLVDPISLQQAADTAAAIAANVLQFPEAK